MVSAPQRREGATGVEINGGTVRFRQPSGESVDAISQVELTVAAGEYVVVIGANGAGKSTLINVIAGTTPLSRGRASIGGEDVGALSERRRSQLVSRVFQNPANGVCGELTLEENLALGSTKGTRRSCFRRARTPSRRDFAHALLAAYGRGLEDRLGQSAMTLSGGQRQLVALAMATAHTPSVLLLDEHTSALDPEIGLVVMARTDELIRERGPTTVMVTHNMDHALRFGDRLLIMSGGRIVRDIAGEKKRALAADTLIDVFRDSVAEEMTDRMLG